MKIKLKKEIVKTPKIAVMTLVLLITLLISLIGAIVRRNWMLCVFTIVIAILISIPRFLEKWSNISIPDGLEVYVILFIYATLFLGELQNYYNTFWWWDVAIHTSSGVALGILGFILLYILYRAGKVKTSPKTIAMFAFVFALALGALWEITEYTLDNTVGTNMQGHSLVDTMQDLIVDAVGALFSSIMGYFYIKKESGIVVKPMVKEFKKDNPRLFKRKKAV